MDQEENALSEQDNEDENEDQLDITKTGPEFYSAILLKPFHNASQPEESPFVDHASSTTTHYEEQFIRGQVESTDSIGQIPSEREYLEIPQSSRVIINDYEHAQYLKSHGRWGRPFLYGELDTLELIPVEALLLLERKKLRLIDEEDGTEIDFTSLLNIYLLDPNTNFDWVRFLVYKDLRSRGYSIREGYGSGIDFRVFERGSSPGSEAKILISCIAEGKPLDIDTLDLITRSSISARKKLALAVVDRIGEVTYYTVAQYPLDINVHASSAHPAGDFGTARKKKKKRR